MEDQISKAVNAYRLNETIFALIIYVLYTSLFLLLTHKVTMDKAFVAKLGEKEQFAWFVFCICCICWGASNIKKKLESILTQRRKRQQQPSAR